MDDPKVFIDVKSNIPGAGKSRAVEAILKALKEAGFAAFTRHVKSDSEEEDERVPFEARDPCAMASGWRGAFITSSGDLVELEPKVVVLYQDITGGASDD